MVRTNERYAEYQADGDQVDGPKAVQEAMVGGGGGGSTVDQTARDAAAAASVVANSKYTKPGSGIPESDLSAALAVKVNAGGAPADGTITAAKLAPELATQINDAGSVAAAASAAVSGKQSAIMNLTPADLDALRVMLSGSRAKFMKGINLGGHFENAWDGANSSILTAPRTAAIMRKIVEAGFDHVRIPVRWTSRMSSDATGVINPTFLALVEGAVDAALANGLGVMLNFHHYRQLEGDALNTNGSLGDQTVQAADVRPRLLNGWRQVAQRFKNRGPGLVFELYNEPHGLLNETDNNTQATRWSLLYPSIVSAIREVDTRRELVIGGSNYNNADGLNFFTSPSSGGPFRLTYHNYHPVAHSHQGWDGRPTGVTISSAGRAHVRAANQTAVNYANAFGMGTAHLGEFGCVRAATDQIKAIAMARYEAELAGVGWCLWTGFDNEQTLSFAANKVDTLEWYPGLLDALFGAGEPSGIPAYPASILTLPDNTTWTQWNGTVLPTVSVGRVSFTNVSARQTVITAVLPSQQLVPGQVLQFTNTGFGNCRFILAVQKKAGTPDLSAGFVYPGQARTLIVPSSVAGDDDISTWKLFLQVESSTSGISYFTPHVCVA